MSTITSQDTTNVTQMGSEMVGTGLFTFIVLQSTQSWQIAVGLLAVIIATQPLSGANLNPAITVGRYASKQCSGEVALKYILSQIIGGALGGLCWYLLYNNNNNSQTGPN